MLRSREHCGRENSPVGEHQREVGPLFAHPVGKLGGSHFARLVHGEAEANGRDLHRRRMQLQPAPCRAIGLAHDGRYLGHPGESLERRHSDFRRSEEDRAHRGEPSKKHRDPASVPVVCALRARMPCFLAKS